MKPIWKSTFLLHAETDEYLENITKAKEALHVAVESHKKTYCSFSGGKDSTVLLWMALQEKPTMLVLHIDFGRWLMPRTIFADICNNAKKQGGRNFRIEGSEQWEKAGRKLPKGGIFGKVLFGRIEPQLHEEGYDCCLLGLRAEESRKRASRTKDKAWDMATIDTAYPISHLSWMDVWACIISNKLPYLSHYDDQEAIGIGYDKSRISSFFTAGRGMMAIHKVMMPEELHQMI
jgi:3'-phosphoadenosine 5'-phosphosulfate sulfotransferase (PAPS reductase)/FAD synthetase